MTTTHTRNYDAIATKLTQSLKPEMSREERMQLLVDLLWDELHESNVSWLGFYLKNVDGPDMLLGPRRDKPACSPIAMFGACGRAFTKGQTLIVTDVSHLHAGYIACDPRDRSELVIPVLEGFGMPYGVLDLDSYMTHAFNRDDAEAIHRLLRLAKLTADLDIGEVETL